MSWTDTLLRRGAGLRGRVEAVDEGVVRGWLWDPREPQARMTLTWRTPDDRLIAATADEARPRLARRGIGDGRHGFTLAFGQATEAGSGSHWLEIGGLPLGLPLRAGARPAPDPRIARFGAGRINGVDALHIHGWLSEAGTRRPLLLVDGAPARLLRCGPTDGRSGARALTGFVFANPGCRPGSRLSLIVAGPRGREHVDAVTLDAAWGLSNPLAGFADIASMAHRPGAVAITLARDAPAAWSRACLLYDLIAPHRPVALIAWLGLSGQKAPAGPQQVGGRRVLGLPWDARLHCERALAAAGLHFETVLVCHPRRQALALAARLSGPRTRLLVDLEDIESGESDGAGGSGGSITERAEARLGMGLALDLPARTAPGQALAGRCGAVWLPGPPAGGGRGSLQGWQRFLEAERVAAAGPPAGHLLGAVPGLGGARSAVWPKQPEPALLLISRQHDAGIYGRRIDQIARRCAQAGGGRRVLILEWMDAASHQAYQAQADNLCADAALVLDAAERKRAGWSHPEGVTLHLRHYEDPEQLPVLFERFLLDQALLPGNTLVVLFPITEGLERCYAQLAPYRKIVDVVDNVFSWSDEKDARGRVHSQQYHALFASAEAVVFNVDTNRRFFQERGYLTPDTVSHLIPNWYRLPAGLPGEPVCDAPGADPDHFELFYSGHMNQRIDWALLAAVAALGKGLRLHLVGVCTRRQPGFEALIARANVRYHGPLDERETLRLLARMDLAVLPHAIDAFSSYMNPLKVMMYRAMGLPTVATPVPGLEADEGLRVAGDAEAFLAAVSAAMDERDALRARRRDARPAAAGGEAYLRLVQRLGKELAAAATSRPPGV